MPALENCVHCGARVDARTSIPSPSACPPAACSARSAGRASHTSRPLSGGTLDALRGPAAPGRSWRDLCWRPGRPGPGPRPRWGPSSATSWAGGRGCCLTYECVSTGSARARPLPRIRTKPRPRSDRHHSVPRTLAKSLRRSLHRTFDPRPGNRSGARPDGRCPDPTDPTRRPARGPRDWPRSVAWPGSVDAWCWA